MKRFDSRRNRRSGARLESVPVQGYALFGRVVLRNEAKKSFVNNKRSASAPTLGDSRMARHGLRCPPSRPTSMTSR
jgi:hypothetical protein